MWWCATGSRCRKGLWRTVLATAAFLGQRIVGCRPCKFNNAVPSARPMENPALTRDVENPANSVINYLSPATIVRRVRGVVRPVVLVPR